MRLRSTLLCFTLAPLLAVPAACSLEAIDLSDKVCPCAPGYTCDDTTMRCVASTAPTCDAAVTVTGFRASWATSNVIRWEWEPMGDRARFVRYEVHVATRPEDIDTELAVVFGPAENPELGGYVLQRSGGADDIVTHTMTDGHAPRTTYAARLVAIDASFCEHRSPVAAITTTLDPPEELVLFRDASSVGSPRPGTIRVVTEGADGYLEHDPSSDVECVMSGEGVCSQNLRWSGLSVAVSDISAGELANTAMLEVVVANDTDTSSFFSRVWVALDDGRIFRMEPFTIANRPTYRTIQVPLRALSDEAAAALLTLDDLASTVSEVNVGGQWSRCARGEAPPCVGGRVRIDEARIRY